MGALRERGVVNLTQSTGLTRLSVSVVLATVFVLAAGLATASERRRVPPNPTTSANNTRAATLESLYRRLSDAQLRQRLAPNAESERSLAQEYARHGVLDMAFDHFQAALQFDAHDAASFEGIARIWRDWGFPGQGLASAYRAVYWDPRSASAQNTLGTLLAQLGYANAARDRFNRALTLDPVSTYPLNNLCYLELAQNELRLAERFCRSALQRDPGSAKARNNLALALTKAGQLNDALALFDESPVTAIGSYNKGLLLLAAGRLDSARDAFAEARIADPSFAPARVRLASLAVTRKER